MVDLEELASIGPGDELDGTKYLFENICTISRIFHVFGGCRLWKQVDLHQSPSHHLWSSAGYKSLEASLPSSAEKDITSTVITLIGLL